MKIGKENYDFMLTVGASMEIAKLCPNGELSRMGELLQGNVSETIGVVAEMIAAMAKGYDDFQTLMGEEVTHKPLTKEMLLALPFQDIRKAQSEMMERFKEGLATSVQVAPSKKNTAE